jgi:hypothetical protein
MNRDQEWVLSAYILTRDYSDRSESRRDDDDDSPRRTYGSTRQQREDTNRRLNSIKRMRGR